MNETLTADRVGILMVAGAEAEVIDDEMKGSPDEATDKTYD